MKEQRKNKITKLDIILTENLTEENYEKAKKEYTEDYETRKAKYIAEYTEYVPGYSTGFFGWKNGMYIHKPDVGAAKWATMTWEKTWEQKYPNGFSEWCKRNGDTLTSKGQQKLIDKINELVDAVNRQGVRVSVIKKKLK